MSTASVTRTAFLLGAALLLTACGTAANPTAAPKRAPGAAVRAKLTKAPALAPLEGALTANRVLTFTHAAARQLDANASFTGLTGTWIDAEGQLTDKGTWTVQYIGSDVAPPKGGQNPYGNKITRRIAITVDGHGVPTVAVTEEAGMPLGITYMDSPLPDLDSSDVLRVVRKERPAGAHFPIDKMTLCGHPRDYQVMLWKIGTLTQSGDRPITINAKTGAIVTNY